MLKKITYQMLVYSNVIQGLNRKNKNTSYITQGKFSIRLTFCSELMLVINGVGGGRRGDSESNSINMVQVDMTRDHFRHAAFVTPPC